jgi:hypothetical protein
MHLASSHCTFVGMAKNEFTLGQALDHFLEDHALIEQSLAREVIAHWPEIAGQPIADQTVALWFKDGTFFLELKSAMWKHEVSYGRSQLVASINRYARRELARELKLV